MKDDDDFGEAVRVQDQPVVQPHDRIDTDKIAQQVGKLYLISSLPVFAGQVQITDLKIGQNATLNSKEKAFGPKSQIHLRKALEQGRSSRVV